jgi:Family of unknown function (DUF5682)
MAELRILGVRHHSPACARLVERVIRQTRPAFVLIEGPADFNDRIAELGLSHTLPIAIYSYRLGALGGGGAAQARGTWTPFCDYSPEWVALREARAHGAEALFIDLPAWDDVFVDCVNRFADRPTPSPIRWDELARGLGFDCSDALWDHLFEGAQEPAQGDGLEANLARYFEELRAVDEATEHGVNPMNHGREAYMAEWIAWALREAPAKSTVVVVCGGYHAPALARAARVSADPQRPTCPQPEDERVGSFLVPFSFKRLDSFTGYAAGMPSPAFYQAVWERREGAAAHMVSEAVRRLRSIGQVVSAADHAAASTMSEGLALIRGHAIPTRVDSLDGLVAALFKEPLTMPLPWSERQVLPEGTDPFLVEVVAAYAGESRGQLAPGTQAPPLLDSLRTELAAADLRFDRTMNRLQLSCVDATTEVRRQLLHRLRTLAVPGVSLTKTPSLDRGAAARHPDAVSEHWALCEEDDTLPCLIERAVYGASLAQAARARLEERAARADELVSLVAVLQDALLAGFGDLMAPLSEVALAVVEKETRFAGAGAALSALVVLSRRVAADTGGTADAMQQLITAVYERALWLLEALADATSAPFQEGDVVAVRAVGRSLDSANTAAGVDVLRRIALRGRAAPSLRGACLGALWSAQQLDGGAMPDEVAAQALASIPSDGLGDYLGGLVLTARQELLDSALIRHVDERLRRLEDEEFLVALPGLRRAFAYFPPRERLEIAGRLIAARGLSLHRGELLRPVALDERAAEVQARVLGIMRRYHLLSAGGSSEEGT